MFRSVQRRLSEDGKDVAAMSRDKSDFAKSTEPALWMWFREVRVWGFWRKAFVFRAPLIAVAAAVALAACGHMYSIYSGLAAPLLGVGGLFAALVLRFLLRLPLQLMALLQLPACPSHERQALQHAWKEGTTP